MAERRSGGANGVGRANDRALGAERRVTRQVIETKTALERTVARDEPVSELERSRDLSEVAVVEQLGRRASDGKRAPLNDNWSNIKNSTAEGNRLATTISTVGAQSSQSRIVVALLKDDRKLLLKIQEMRPGLFEVGANLAECRRYRDEHKRLLRALERCKEAPIESWMAKFKRVEAEQANMSKEMRLVYLCMAENLQGCWRALLDQLELRLRLLEETCEFFASIVLLVEGLNRADNHVQAFRQEFLTGAGSARFAQVSGELEKMNEQILSNFQICERRQLHLLELIGKMATSNLGDARQDLLVNEAQTLTHFVRAALEPLERRKMQLESVITSTSTTVDKRTNINSDSMRDKTDEAPGTLNSSVHQHKTRTILAESASQQSRQTGGSHWQPANVVREIGSFNELNLVENWLNVKISQMNSSLLSSLGLSSQDARSILNKHEQIALECSAIEGVLLKVRGKDALGARSAASNQQEVASQDPKTQKLLEEQRQLATKTRHVITILEARIVLLRRTLDFYARSRNATKDISQMMRRLQVDDSLQSVQFVADELELKDVSSVVASGATIVSELQQLQLAQQHGQRSSIISLQLVTNGIRNVIDQLNQELAHLKTLLNQRRLVLLNEDSSKMAENFSNKCRQLKFWLDSRAQSFLLSNNRIGCELGAVRSWCESHEELRRSMRDKTLEVEALLRLLSTLIEHFGAKSQTGEEIRRDADELRQAWISVSNCLEQRLEFACRYAKLLQQLAQLRAEIDKLAAWNNLPAGSADGRSLDEVKSQVEQSVAQLAGQVSQFTEEATRYQTALAQIQPLEHRSTLNDINKQQIVGHASGALKLLVERNKSSTARLDARGPRKWTESNGPQKPEVRSIVDSQTLESTHTEESTAVTETRNMASVTEDQQQQQQQQTEKELAELKSRPLEGGVSARKRRLSRQLAPVFSQPLHDLEVEPFGSVSLECQLDPASTLNLAGNHTQQIKVEWLLNNKRIPANIKHSTTSEANRHRLSISQFGPTCCGLYTARAINQLNGESASTSCRLRLSGIREADDAFEATPTVVATPSSTSPTSGTTNSSSTRRPQIASDFNNQRQGRRPVGKERALERIIQGVGSPGACQDDLELADDATGSHTSKTTIKGQFGERQLAQLPLAAAFYRGQQQLARHQLNVDDSPNAPSAASRSISRSPLEGTPEPPVFASGLGDALARVASRAALVCVVIGNPPPLVEWLHDGRPIASARCARSLGQPRASLCKLTIETVDDRTRGQYVCRATNRLGQSNSAPLTLAK